MLTLFRHVLSLRFFSSGFIIKIFGLSEFALTGQWTVLALHGHEVTVTKSLLLIFFCLFHLKV